MTRALIILAVIISYNGNSYAQNQTTAKTQLKSLISYFNGKWKGKGHFANGKDISSTIAFNIPLDSAWLIATHVDNPPNQYKAMSVWGVDAPGEKLMAQIFDNYGGSRSFETLGWDGSVLILYRAYERKGGVKAFERFTYSTTDNQHFNLKYELSADNLTWHLGDELLFTKLN